MLNAVGRIRRRVGARAQERRRGGGRILGEIALQRVEPTRPELLVAREPALRLLKRGGAEPACHDAAGLAARDETGARQHIEMLQDRRQGHPERLGQFGHRQLRCVAKAGKHGASGRIGQRREDAVEAVRGMVNHMVNLSSSDCAVNPPARRRITHSGGRQPANASRRSNPSNSAILNDFLTRTI
jgi:hypothetical protein